MPLNILASVNIQKVCGNTYRTVERLDVNNPNSKYGRLPFASLNLPNIVLDIIMEIEKGIASKAISRSLIPRSVNNNTRYENTTTTPPFERKYMVCKSYYDISIQVGIVLDDH